MTFACLALLILNNMYTVDPHREINPDIEYDFSIKTTLRIDDKNNGEDNVRLVSKLMSDISDKVDFPEFDKMTIKKLGGFLYEWEVSYTDYISADIPTEVYYVSHRLENRIIDELQSRCDEDLNISVEGIDVEIMES